MRPSVDQLHTSGHYQLLESFSIDAMMTFVTRELGMQPAKTAQPMSPVRRGLRLTGVMVISGLLGYELTTRLLAGAGKGAIGSGFTQLSLGMVAFFLLLPIHEFIHGLAFRYIGATRVGYGWAPKSLMVYAYSQNFPATMREVAFVAVMPFIVISTTLFIGLTVWPQFSVFWITLLLVHTSGCLGDLALILYWYKNRRRTIYTYDDVEGERRTYFFEAV